MIAAPFLLSKEEAMRVLMVVICALVITLQAKADNYTTARRAVCHYFGSYCSQAMAVVRCETGGTYWTWAANGQYLGLFQMGAQERAIYGHGPDAWSQARAAYHYFVDSGRDWSPWACGWAA